VVAKKEKGKKLHQVLGTAKNTPSNKKYIL
jgi:hypothetical protein